MEAANLHKKTATAGAGELVLQNGRQAGARRPLGVPTTFVGRSPGCDIRLNVEGVDPLHCVLAFGPDGVVLRDLDSVHGTYVNGVRAEHLLLKDGDNVKVGPFHFRLELAQATAQAEPDGPPADEVRDALRIQAAAVAAQQAALDEEESRLRQRKGDLQQQEEQLAAHLAEKQRQVQLWSEYTKAERETLRKEKLENEKKLARLEEELLKAKEELAKDHQKLTAERQHINNVYQRLRQRWQRQWATEREKYQTQASALEADKNIFEQRQNALARRETVLAQDVLRFNTERALATRRLKEERAVLTRNQQSWRKRRSLEFTALKNRRRELEATDAKVAEVRQVLRQEQEAWRRQQETLQKELHGLNNRVVHQRGRIQEQTAEIARLDAQRRERQPLAIAAPVDAPETTVAPPAQVEAEVLDEAAAPSVANVWQRRCDYLNRVAGELADQRALLVEQFTRLAAIQELWQRRRDQAAAELESLGQRLVVEEQALIERQQQNTIAETVLHQRQAENDAIRQDIMLWRAQLETREQSFAAVQQKAHAELYRKDSLVNEQLAALMQLRQRWNQRRQQEVERLRDDRKLLECDQKETQERRLGLFEKSQQLAEEKRALGEKSLALEQYRQEVFLRTKDPAAQRRVERLRRRWLSLNAAMIANAKAERDVTRKELARLEACRTELHQQFAAATASEMKRAEQQSLLDERALTPGNRPGQEADPLRMKEAVAEMANAAFDEKDAAPLEKAA